MPIRQSSARKRQTQGLRQRMRALTRYEPESASTDDDNDSDRFLGITQPLGQSHHSNQPSKTVIQHATEQSILKKIDVEILRIITGLADQRAQARARAEKEQQQQDIYGSYNYNGKMKEEEEDLDFVDAFQAFEAFTETNKLTRNSYNNYFTVLNILVNLCEQEPIPQERDTWTVRLMAYLKTYSASELRRAKATLMRARLHSFDNRTRNRFLGLWYESSAVLHERDQRLGEIAVQYDWCRAVSGQIQVWRERSAEQHARENAASLLADRRLKRYAFDKLLGRCQGVTDAEEVADRVAKTQFLLPQMATFPAADSVTTNPAAAAAAVVVDHDDDEYIPETPTRPRVRKTVPYTSLGRWRRTRTPGTLGTVPRFEPTTTSKFRIAQSNAAAASPSDGR
ncbi:hypothetical protein D0Z03_001244 [Geotrichum reessii]|nr:hypothetical protein D0Z03_001244 [Galactomyces reessii]